MAVSVAELLAEPQLGLTLLAGSAGLANRITWAHTSDLPRLWEWVTGGELMMTNGLSLPTDAAGQVELAHALVRAGASALAVGEKMHAPALLPEFLAACDSLPLPVINVPYPLPFIAIARSVAEASLLEESRRLRQTARIYDLLRRVGAAGNAWPELRARVGAELDALLFVLDKRCLHPWNAGDGGLSPELARELAPLLGHDEAPAKQFRWHHVGGDRQVLTLDVPTHAHALLVVLPNSDQHPDALLLLHAATVLGLELSRVVLDRENQHRLVSEFLLQAFDGHYGLAELEGRLSSFGVPAQGFVVASMASADGRGLDTAHTDLWRHGIASACLRRADKLHLVLFTAFTPQTLRHAVGPDMRIGLSRPATAAGLQTARQESLWALAAAQDSDGGLVRYAEGQPWLGLTSVAEGQALVQHVLGPVIDYERGRQPDLILTLATYLDNQRSWQKTATILHVHRQTIIYRIRKISELTGLDLSETSALA
ncbi:PucR family transcriptional regulator, partial [Arthrobacter sp. SDTb3-6]|uniref:PucR family transcriptional regulator n=1 Tax=Arthrobacter sp. SDTb3-6 TaxID=2713571 RepID=UPI00159DFE97|nr:PucR family transcriptional regulator [Arthrobacter sp. SDTb3-6]